MNCTVARRGDLKNRPLAPPVIAAITTSLFHQKAVTSQYLKLFFFFRFNCEFDKNQILAAVSEPLHDATPFSLPTYAIRFTREHVPETACTFPRLIE